MDQNQACKTGWQNTPSRNLRSLRLLRRSTGIGIALWLEENGILTLDQRLWVAMEQSKLNEAQLQRAMKVLVSLQQQPRVRATLRPLSYRVPVPKHVIIREQRRIGVGYRDKGSARPTHKPRLPTERELSYSEIVLWLGEDLPDWYSHRLSYAEVMTQMRVAQHYRVPNFARLRPKKRRRLIRKGRAVFDREASARATPLKRSLF